MQIAKFTNTGLMKSESGVQ